MRSTYEFNQAYRHVRELGNGYECEMPTEVSRVVKCLLKEFPKVSRAQNLSYNENHNTVKIHFLRAGYQSPKMMLDASRLVMVRHLLDFGWSMREIADAMNFSETQALMRWHKRLTGFRARGLATEKLWAKAHNFWFSAFTRLDKTHGR